MENFNNLAYVLHGAKDLRVEEYPIGEVGHDDVLLKVGYVGLCGSDLHQYKDGRIGAKVLTRPLVVGHEASATVLKCGPNVSLLTPGDLVAIEPGISCNRCDLCKCGRYNLCPSVKFFSSFGPVTDGVLCKYKVHPANLCHKLAPCVGLSAGALVEPLSVAVHACRRAQVQPGRTVCISGAGPVGVLCALVATEMGAADVILTDVNESRLHLVNEILPKCSTIVVRRGEEFSLHDELLSRINHLPHIFIECSGVSACLAQAVTHTKSGGTVVCVGIGQPNLNVHLSTVITKELNIKGVFRYANCFPTAIGIVKRHHDKLNKLISKIYPFHDAKSAYEHAVSATAFKILIKCDNN